MSKTMENLIDEMRSPEHMELQARYQNARDAVAWAWKIAQDLATNGKLDPLPFTMSTQATELRAWIERDLNSTLDVLKDKDGTKTEPA